MPGFESNWDAGWRIMREAIRPSPNASRPTSQQLQTLSQRLGYARHAVSVAEGLARRNRQTGVATRLRQAGVHMDRIIAGVDGLTTASDIADVVSAVQRLQSIGAIASNTRGAAVAFGQLFSALGRLCSHLPPPLNTYADFLAASGNFFSDVRDLIDPQTRFSHREDGGAVDTSRPYRP